uniref:Endonuclease/exonuclease/phosphatase domain-containing protein n=1 Tax=Cacopsylla melanoneura TaxID=428564 RepID=A0A8D9BP25_9HEMI
MTHWNKFSQDEETLWVKCTLYGQEVYIALSYFPSPVKPKTLQNFSETLCNRVELAQKRLILLGDYNIPEYQIDTEELTNQNPQSNRILYINRLMSFYELKSFNQIKNKFGRTLDLYLSNFDNFQISRNKISHTHIKLEDGLVKPNDHHPPLLINLEVVKTGSIKSNNPTLDKEPKLFFRKTDFDKLKTELGKKNWDKLDKKPNANDCLNYFYQELNSTFDTCVPKFSPKNKKQKFPFWWDKKSIKMFKKKERLRKIKKLSAKQEIELKNLKKSCKVRIKQDYLNHVKQISQEIKKRKQ